MIIFKGIKILFLLLFMYSCQENDSKYIKNIINLNRLKILDSISIIDAKQNIFGDKFIVYCRNHDSNTHIMIEDHPLVSIHYDSALVCNIPPKYINKDFSYCLINNKKKLRTNIYQFKFEESLYKQPFGITSCGFSGNAIWIICSNQTRSTQIYYNNKKIETLLYPDHIVGILPPNIEYSDSVIVKIRDIIKEQEMTLIVRR